MHRKTRTCLISVSRPPEDNNSIFQPEIIFLIFSTRGRQCSLFILLRDKGTSSMIWNLCEELCSRGSTGSYRNLPFGHYNKLLTCFQKDFKLLKIPFMAIIF